VKKSELINVLNSFPDLPVVVTGYEGGTNPLEKENIALKYVDKKGGSDWFGQYGGGEDSPDGMEDPELVIYLSRSSTT